MKLSEVAVVLAKAAAYDNRQPAEATARAWHEILHDIDLDDALAAVARHYRDHTEWLMPAHLRRLALLIRDERRRRDQSPVRAMLPGRYEPDVTREIRIERGVAQCQPVMAEIAKRLRRKEIRS